MKRLTLTMIAICALLGTSRAEDFSDIWLTSAQTEGTVYIIGVKPGVELKGDVVIPGYDDKGNKVVGIGRTSYNVVDEDKFKPAIYDFKYITSVTLPATLQNLSETEFLGCSGIEAYYVEEGNENFVSRNGILYSRGYPNAVLKSNFTLVKYPPRKLDQDWTMPSDVVYVKGWAFADQQELYRLYVQSDDKTIWSTDAMYGNKSLRAIFITSQTASKEENRLTVNGGILYANDGRELFMVPPYYTIGGIFEISEDVEKIRKGALGWSAASGIKFHDKPIVLSSEAFRGAAFQNVVLPATVSFTESNAGVGLFRDCDALKTADLSALDFFWIPERLFQDCSSLREVTLPEYSRKPGSFCFYGCKSLKNLDMSQFTVLYGDENKCQYAFANSGLEKVVFGNSWDIIPYCAFMGCKDLTEVEFGGMVKEIGKFGFYGCGIQNVNTSNIRKINDWAFKECPIVNFTIPINGPKLEMGLDVAHIGFGGIYFGSLNLGYCGVGGDRDWTSSLRYEAETRLYSCELQPQTFFNHTSQAWYSLGVPGRAAENYAPFAGNKSTEMYTITTNFKTGSVNVNMGDFSRSVESVWINGKEATVDPVSGEYTIAEEVDNMAVRINYKVNGRQFTTFYPEGYLEDDAKKNLDNSISELLADGSAVQIFTMQGAEVYSGVVRVQDLHLPKGVYIVRQGHATKKIKL